MKKITGTFHFEKLSDVVIRDMAVRTILGCCRPCVYPGRETSIEITKRLNNVDLRVLAPV